MDPKNEHDQHTESNGPDQHGGPPGRNGADTDQQSGQHKQPPGQPARPNKQHGQADQPDPADRNQPDQIKNSPGPTPEPQAPGTVPDWSELGRGTTQTPKGVREILKTYFNDAQIDRADQYHSFFSSWKQLAGINIAAHTRPRDIRNRVLIIEADHPGWVQLLQMKTKPILRKIQRDFPQLDIKDLRIVVGELPPEKNALATDQTPTPPSPPEPATAPPESADGSASPAPEPEDQDSSHHKSGHKSRFEQALENLGRQVKDSNTPE